MSYYINAWLENGDPRLQIIDAQSKSVCVSWDYLAPKNAENKDKNEIQRLFKELLMLTCKHKVTNARIFEIKQS
jgi:hypothetical protein